MVGRSLQAAEADLPESAVTFEYQSWADQLPPLQNKASDLCVSLHLWGRRLQYPLEQPSPVPDLGLCECRSRYWAANQCDLTCRFNR